MKTMRSPRSRAESPYRQPTRDEKRRRRQVKRDYISAVRAVTLFTLDFYGGRLDHLPASRLDIQRTEIVARYREARASYVVVFGAVMS